MMKYQKWIVFLQQNYVWKSSQEDVKSKYLNDMPRSSTAHGAQK